MEPKNPKAAQGAVQRLDRLEDLPNIGKSLAADLRRIGVLKPQDLVSKEPLVTFRELAYVMGHRHDPCVLYTLLAVKHFLQHSEALPWWKFTAEGKVILTDSDAKCEVPGTYA